MRSLKHWICSGFTLLGLWGCTGDKEALRPEGAGAQEQASGPALIRPTPGPGETVSENDLNGDGRPEVWTYVLKEAGPDGVARERVVRKEVDVNFDGRVDLAQHYDASGAKVREVLDLDYDGKVDATYFFEKGVNVRREQDLDANGRTDVWKHYEKGKLVRKERDSDGDGRVDYWEYWEKDQVDRIGEDVDGDGSVDRWMKNPEAP